MACKRCCVRFFYFLVVFFIINLAPGLPPNNVFPFEEYSIVKPKGLVGPLESNTLLDNAEQLFKGRLLAPEHLLLRGNTIYASLYGGEIVKIEGDKITTIAQFGEPQFPGFEEKLLVQGRPLGIAFDTLGDNLIVADSYNGIYELNLKSGDKKLLINGRVVIDGKTARVPKFINSVAVSKNGDIYWTHSSSEFDFNDGALSFFLNPSGRLFHYSRASRKNTLLIDELFFPNGVVLSPNEDFLLVSETHASRILKYTIKGQNAGTKEIFLEGLPGVPDNITPDEDGVWIAFAAGCDPQNPLLTQSMYEIPLVRRFIVRLITLVKMPFAFVEQYYPNLFTKSALNYIGSFKMFTSFFSKRSTIVRSDWNGNISGSMHGYDESVKQISHVLEYGDYLYLGSYSSDFIGRVKFFNKDQIHSKKTAPKLQVSTPTPTTTTPKPTTTTPKPTTTTPKPTTTTPKPATTTPTPTTQKQTTTTTPKPTTTTPKPATTTTTPKPVTTTTTQKPTTQKQTTTTTTSTPTTQKQTTKPTPAPTKPTTTKPAPIHEKVKDIPPPQPKEPLKVITKEGPGTI